MKNAALYIRVSTLEQAQHGYSIEEQKQRLTSYCQAMGWNIVNTYVDGGYSGSTTDRPGLQKLLSETNEFSIVVIYKLDRLSRSQKDTLFLIEDVFIKNNIDIVSLQENLDTSSAFGRAAIGVLSAFAQLERETFKERSKLGRTGRAKKGKWVGSSKPPIGYDYDVENQELIINEYEAIQIREIFNMYVQGNGMQKIAKTLYDKKYTHKYGDWTWWGSVNNILKNPVYIGRVSFAGELYKGNHQPIIDEELFKKAQDNLENRKTGETFKRRSTLSQFLYCGNCGARMFFLSGKKKLPKYVCYSRYGRPIGQVKDKNCKMKRWNSFDVEDYILYKIKSIANDSAFSISREKPKSNINSLQTRIESIEKQTSRLMDLYEFDKISKADLNKRISELYDEKESILKIIKNYKEEKQDVTEIKKIAAYVSANWETMELNLKIDFLSKLINKIIIYEESIDIQWVFKQ